MGGGRWAGGQSGSGGCAARDQALAIEQAGDAPQCEDVDRQQQRLQGIFEGLLRMPLRRQLFKRLCRLPDRGDRNDRNDRSGHYCRL